MSETKARLIVTVGPDGTVQVRTEQVVGERCLDLVEIAEDLVEGSVVSSQPTADYYRLPEVVEEGGSVAERLETRE